jgi:adenine phosphoribosyltransferase
MADANDDIRRRIRTIPDFPKPGIMFRDITTLLLDAEGLALTIERMAAQVEGKVDLVAGDRGARLPVRRGAGGEAGHRRAADPQGRQAARRDDRRGLYARIWHRSHRDPCRCLRARRAGAAVDDLIATGGTARAAVRLLRKAGAEVTRRRS